MDKFEHTFDFAFTLISDNFYGKDISPFMLREALLKRINTMSMGEFQEACGWLETNKLSTTQH